MILAGDSRESPSASLPKESSRPGVDEHCALVAVIRGSVLIFFKRSRGALSRRRRQRDSLSRPVRVSQGSISMTGSKRGSPGDPNRTRRYTKLAIIRQLNGFMRLTTTQHSTDDMPPCWMSTFSVHTHPREERPHVRAAQIPPIYIVARDENVPLWGIWNIFFFLHNFTRNSIFDMISREKFFYFWRDLMRVILRK